MTYLSDASITLKGGCMCKAVRYKINIPPILERPLAPGALPTPRIDADDNITEIETRFPLIAIDHCNSCRTSSGALFQTWIIMQHAWLEFHLQSRQADDSSSYVQLFVDGAASTHKCGDAVVPSPDLREKTYIAAYRSSEHSVRTFCSRCGTSISYCYDGDRGSRWTLGPVVDIALGTLDRDALAKVRIERQLWCHHGVDWVMNLTGVGTESGVLCHPDGRPSEKI